MLTALAGWVLVQQSTPLAKYQRWVESRPSLRCEGTITHPQMSVPGSFVMEWTSEPRQRFVLSWPQKYEVRQVGRKVIAIRHWLKEYTTFSFPMIAPGEKNPPQIVNFGYPHLLTPYGAKRLASVPGWAKVDPPSDLQNVESYQASTEGMGGRETLTLSIRKSGEPVRLLHEVQGTGPAEFNFSKITGADLNDINLDPPDGFVPLVLDQPGMSPPPGSPAPIGSYALKSGAVDLSRMFTKGDLIIAFLSPGHKPDDAMRASLAKLHEDTKGSATLLEVAMDQADSPPSAPWKQVEDAGHLADAFMVDMTPYVVRIKAGGTVRSAWMGWWDGAEAEMLETLKPKEAAEPEGESQFQLELSTRSANISAEKSS